MNTLQSLSSELIASTKDTHEKNHALNSDLAFLTAKESFFDFIVKHKPVGYITWDFNPARYTSGDSFVEASMFSLNVNGFDEAQGLLFEHVFTDAYDCEMVCFFRIPLAYLDNTEAWEANLLATIEEVAYHAKLAVVAAFGKRVANNASFVGKRINEKEVSVQVTTPRKELPEKFRNSHLLGPIVLNLETTLVTGAHRRYNGDIISEEVIGKVYKDLSL